MVHLTLTNRSISSLCFSIRAMFVKAFLEFSFVNSVLAT